MLLVVCPNLAVDRILQVDGFQPHKVQRSRTILTQPGGKGSNAARVFRQLGGDVVLTGFVGRRNGSWIIEPLEKIGITVDAVTAYEGQSRTCTIICDPASRSHPTVVNEESPPIDSTARDKLIRIVEKWLPRVDAVFTTGSLSRGLPAHFYAEVLDRARWRRKITAIDASGDVLKNGLLVRPAFAKPNGDEFRQLTNSGNFSIFATHMAITFGERGAVLIENGKYIHAAPPRVFDTNPIGAGDAFAAGYIKGLLSGAESLQCLRLATAAGTCDAGTIQPGFVDRRVVRALASQVEAIFQ